MLSTEDLVLTLFKEKAIIVRTPSVSNPTRGILPGADHLMYERTTALLDPRGKSASILMPNIPLSPYSGNVYFFIYDYRQLDIILAITSDGGIADGPEITLDSSKTPPKPIQHGGYTDYSRYMKQGSRDIPGTIDGITNKMRRLNAKRLGNPSSLYFGAARFGHTELLIKIKPGCDPSNAIIGIGVCKQSLSNPVSIARINLAKKELVDSKGEPLPFYTYHPDEGVAPMPSYLLSPWMQWHAKLQEFHEKPSLSDKHWICFNTLSWAYQNNSDENPLYKRDFQTFAPNSKKIDAGLLKRTEYSPRFYDALSDLIRAQSREDIKRLEYQSLAYIYLKWFFNDKGEKIYNPWGSIETDIDHLSSVQLIRTVDIDTQLPHFSFSLQGRYGKKAITVDVEVAMICGVVTLFGRIEGVSFQLMSHDIMCRPAGYRADMGALMTLEGSYIKQKLHRMKTYLLPKDILVQCIFQHIFTICFENASLYQNFLKKTLELYPQISQIVPSPTIKRIQLSLPNHITFTIKKSFESDEIVCQIRGMMNLIHSIDATSKISRLLNVDSKTKMRTYSDIDACLNQLKGCGVIGATILDKIKRLEYGAKSHNPYWMNSSKKLSVILDVLIKQSDQLNELHVKAMICDRSSLLYKALNMPRLSRITFLGQLGWDNTKSLQSIQKVVTTGALKI